MSCAERPRLSALVRGTLSWREREELLAHVEQCAECHAALAALGAEGELGPSLYVPSESLVAATIGTGSLFGECLSPETLERIAAGSDPVARDEWELEHLATCRACQAELELAVLTLDEQAGAYVPGAAIVDRAVSGSPRGRPRFAMPKHLMGRSPVLGARITPARAAAAAFAAMGLTPSALAAAVVMHVAIFAAAGLWITRGASAVQRLGEARAASERVERIDFVQPTPARARAGEVPVRRGRAVQRQDLAAADSAQARAAASRWLQERQAERANANARWTEITAAVNTELRFEGERVEPVAATQSALERIVRALLAYPAIRVRLEQRAERRLVEDSLTLPWRRAASMRAFFRANGVDSSRVLTVIEPLPEAECSTRERFCGARQTMKVEVELIPLPQ